MASGPILFLLVVVFFFGFGRCLCSLNRNYNEYCLLVQTSCLLNKSISHSKCKPNRSSLFLSLAPATASNERLLGDKCVLNQQHRCLHFKCVAFLYATFFSLTTHHPYNIVYGAFHIFAYLHSKSLSKFKI